jgi:hypothetical protein
MSLGWPTRTSDDPVAGDFTERQECNGVTDRSGRFHSASIVSERKPDEILLQV